MSAQPSELVVEVTPCRGKVVLHVDGSRSCATCAAIGRRFPALTHQRVMTCPGCPSCLPAGPAVTADSIF